MRITLRFFVAAAVLSSSALRLSAQTTTVGKAFQATPYAGVMVFGNYLSGPLGTGVANAPAPIYGAQLAMAIAPDFSLVGNVGYTTSDVKIGIPILGGYSIGHSAMLMYDAGLQYTLPRSQLGSTAFVPFVQGGVGAIRNDINVSLLTTQATNIAFNLGVGADVAVGRGTALRVMVKDYAGKFDFKEATTLNVSGQTTHNYAFSAGFRFDF